MLLWTLRGMYFFQISVFTISGYTPRSSVVGSSGSSVFRFLMNLCTKLTSQIAFKRNALSPSPLPSPYGSRQAPLLPLHFLLFLWDCNFYVRVHSGLALLRLLQESELPFQKAIIHIYAWKHWKIPIVLRRGLGGKKISHILLGYSSWCRINLTWDR